MPPLDPNNSAEISEDEATGDIAVLYEDIRTVLGTGTTPLVFRTLASLPAVLPWCWRVIRPLYTSGRAAGTGGRLVEEIAPPILSPLPIALFTALGLDGDPLDHIRRTLNQFNHSNPMNLVTLSALLRFLELPPADTAPPGETLESDEGSFRPSSPEPVRLSMLRADELDRSLFGLIWELQGIGLPPELRPRAGERGKSTQGMASVWRILARWPIYLGLALVVLRSQEESGWLERAMAEVRTNTVAEVEQLLPLLSAPEGIAAPEVEQLEAARAVLIRFAGIRLVRILPVVKALQCTLPVV